MRISDWSSDVCSSDLFRDRGAYGGKEWGVDEAVTRLVGEGRIRHTIVVGIWNTPKRLREYMPAKVFARLPDDQRQRVEKLYQGTPLSDAYLDRKRTRLNSSH